MAELKSPVLPGHSSEEVQYVDNDPEHYPIPALRKPGSVLMRLEFDDDERRAIAVGADLRIEVLTSLGIQPMRFLVGEEEFWKKEGY